MVIELVYAWIPGERQREYVGYIMEGVIHWKDGTTGTWVVT